MKLFRLLGMSERQGFGGPLIYKTAANYDLRKPELTTDLEHTEIKVWNVDVADSYPNLDQDEKKVFSCVVKNQPQSINTIRKILGMTEYRVRKAMESLEKQKLVEKIGNGPATKYIVATDQPEFLTKLQITMDYLKKHIGQDR